MGKIIDAIWGWIRNIEWTDIATILSMIFVAWQTLLLRKTYQYNCDWQEKEKAAKLAAEYKDNIIPSMGYISAVLKGTGTMDILKDIHADNIEQFNQTELFRLTNGRIIEEVEAVQQRPDTIRILLGNRGRFGQVYNKKLHNINSELIAKWYNTRDNVKDQDGKEIKITAGEEAVLLSALWYEYNSVVTDALNNLEYFAMHFVSGIADDTVIFQSLHQTYLSVVQMLYYNIAVQNVYEKDKYYTNVICLYKRWREKDMENERAVSDAIPKAKPVRK